MKDRSEVTPEKLRGGFYTPMELASFCLRRVAEHLPDVQRAHLLEPSVGDGGFLRALRRGEPGLLSRIGAITALEPQEIEAKKARQELAATGLGGEVQVESAIAWGAEANGEFDAAVGNPPFVRFQFLAQRDKASMAVLASRLGLRFAGVSNLWIPVLLSALSRLRRGGAFAFVVPTEILTGLAAATVREWLVENCASVRFDLFEPGSFPGVLQEVGVLSGTRLDRRGAVPLRTTVVEHKPGEHERACQHFVTPGARTWTKLLLEPAQAEALAQASELNGVRPLGGVAKFEVSIVTGANAFFSVDEETLRRFDLEQWAKPLLPRIRHAPGIVYTDYDQQATRASDARTWLLDFAADRPSPLSHSAAREYLRSGEGRDLHRRFKCRVREPWYRVPGVKRGSLMLSKRSHLYPRVIVNETGVFTTDTIYRGSMTSHDLAARDLSAAFHNSLTLLTAEIEGRSFGGGVLELVPSEVGALLLPAVSGVGNELAYLDHCLRTEGPGALTRATDDVLAERGVVSAELLSVLRGARERLMARRLDRNQRASLDKAGSASEAA